jgi:hypothetical protein
VEFFLLQNVVEDRTESGKAVIRRLVVSFINTVILQYTDTPLTYVHCSLVEIYYYYYQRLAKVIALVRLSE